MILQNDIVKCCYCHKIMDMSSKQSFFMCCQINLATCMGCAIKICPKCNHQRAKKIRMGKSSNISVMPNGAKNILSNQTKNPQEKDSRQKEPGQKQRKKNNPIFQTCMSCLEIIKQANLTFNNLNQGIFLCRTCNDQIKQVQNEHSYMSQLKKISIQKYSNKGSVNVGNLQKVTKFPCDQCTNQFDCQNYVRKINVSEINPKFICFKCQKDNKQFNKLQIQQAHKMGIFNSQNKQFLTHEFNETPKNTKFKQQIKKDSNLKDGNHNKQTQLKPVQWFLNQVKQQASKKQVNRGSSLAESRVQNCLMQSLIDRSKVFQVEQMEDFQVFDINFQEQQDCSGQDSYKKDRKFLKKGINLETIIPTVSNNSMKACVKCNYFVISKNGINFNIDTGYIVCGHQLTLNQKTYFENLLFFCKSCISIQITQTKYEKLLARE